MPCGSWGMTNWEQQCYYHTVAPLKSSVAPRCVVVVVFQPVTHVSAMTLCDPMDCNTPGFPVLHCLLEFAQIHVRWVSSAIQPSHPLSPASPPALHFPSIRIFYSWVGSWHQVAKVLDLQLQHQSFQWKFRVDFLYDWLVWFPYSPRDSQESSPTPHFNS